MQMAVAQNELPLDAKRADRLRDLVLVRLACAQGGVPKAEVAADLAPLASDQPLARWRAEVDREIDRLASAGLLAGTPSRRQASV